MPEEFPVHPRSFADADMKLTGVMHRAAQMAGDGNPAVAALATEILEICTGKTPVVHADEVNARATATKATEVSPENELNDPLVVPRPVG